MSDQWQMPFAGGKPVETVPRGHNYAIGVDPGLATGFVVYDLIKREFVSMVTTTFWDLFVMLSKYDPAQYRFVVENSSLNKFTYGRHATDEKSQGEAGRINRNAGGNNRESELMVEGLRRRGYHVEEVRPSRATKKRTHQQFQAMTKYTGRTNQHVRDAGLLVWGL